MDKYTNHLPIGAHRVMITEVGSGTSSVKGTPFISVRFALVEDTTRSIVRKYYTTDKALAFFMDLYDAAMPPAEWDFPENPDDETAHDERLRGRIVWINVEAKEDQSDPEVTACRPDALEAPRFKARKGKVTRESADEARARMAVQPPQSSAPADDDIPF